MARNTTQLRRVVLALIDAIPLLLVTQPPQSPKGQQYRACPSNMVAHRLADVLPAIHNRPHRQGRYGARASLDANLMIRLGQQCAIDASAKDIGHAPCIYEPT